MVLGAVYAAWSDVASVTVSASTGYLDTDFEIGSQSMSAQVTMDVSVQGSDAGNDGDPSASIVVGNLYPGAYAEQYLYLNNDGTIDVKVTSCTISVANTTVPESEQQYVRITFGMDGTSPVTYTLAELVQQPVTYNVNGVISVGGFKTMKIRIDVDYAATEALEETQLQLSISCTAVQAVP